MSDDIRLETGTYQCPMCGSAEPHQHPAGSIRWFADHVPLFVASNRSADYLRFKSYNCDPDGNNVRFIYPEVQLCWENYCQGFVQATLESSDRAHTEKPNER